MNLDVLKLVYGEDNVTGDVTVAGGITVKANSKDLPQNSMVFDIILKGGILKRIVILPLPSQK